MLQTQTIETQTGFQATTAFGLRAYLCNGERFKAAVKELVICATKEPSRFNLNGVCFDNGTSGVAMVATCGHHLGYVPFDHAFMQNQHRCKVILGIDELKALAKAIKKNDSVCFQRVEMPNGLAGIHFSWSSNEAGQTLGHQDGTFPDWRIALKPAVGEYKEFRVDREQLVDLCKEAVGWYDKPKDVLPVDFDFDSAGLHLTTKIWREDFTVSRWSAERHTLEHLQTGCIFTDKADTALVKLNPVYVLKYAQTVTGKFIKIEIPPKESYPLFFTAWNSPTTWGLMPCRP